MSSDNVVKFAVYLLILFEGTALKSPCKRNELEARIVKMFASFIICAKIG